MEKNRFVVCIDPLIGYTTKGRIYHITDVLPETQRFKIIDDHGLECHAKCDRFLSELGFKEYLKTNTLTQDEIWSFVHTSFCFAKEYGCS